MSGVAPAVGLDRETLEMTLEAIRQFAAEHLGRDVLLDLDARDECPEALVRAMCTDMGIHLLFIPEDCDGMGAGTFDVYRVCETLAGLDLGVATAVFATFLGSDPILFGGTEEQRKKWMTKVANEALLMAYAATEPEAGSDLGALRTVAKPVEEDGKVVGYRLSGAKQWISNGGIADLYTVLAKTPGGPSWFVVEKGVEGLSHGKPEDKHGIRASNTASVTLDDVYVDAGELMGHVEGQGLLQAQNVFGHTRLMVAAFGLGAGWSALDRAIPYSTTRIQGGSPLSEKQGYTHKLIVPHVARLEAARAFIEETATLLDAGEGHGGALNTEGAIAKYMATEAGNAAADASIQALGGYGYTREYMVEKVKRDVRITTIYEGTSEIMEMTIARDRWQLHLKTRGEHYHGEAVKLEALHALQPGVGADLAARGLHALAEVLERSRVQRLTRNQHILFRLGELIAWAETAGAMARRAAAAAAGTLHEKADARFTAEGLAILSRVFCREAALRVALEGARWVVGADGLPDAAAGMGGGVPEMERALGLETIWRAQAGLVADMDRAADVLYGRSAD